MNPGSIKQGNRWKRADINGFGFPGEHGFGSKPEKWTSVENNHRVETAISESGFPGDVHSLLWSRRVGFAGPKVSLKIHSPVQALS